MTNKEKQLRQVALDLKNKSTCPLKATATQPVPGEGSADAEIFFIGEAPGRNEDEQGRPFIGAAGKVLEGLLASIGLTREDVFITSIEKFRPPKNREPRHEEIMACFPALQKQIEIISPKLIVTLGRHSLRRMLEWEEGKEMKAPPSMEKLRGKIIEGNSGRRYYPIHHPAAVLYNPKLRATLEEDFKMILEYIK